MLNKIDSVIYDYYYTGENNKYKVVCVLDDDCVSYMVKNKITGKHITHKYKNENKKTCLKNAKKILTEVV